MDFTSLLPLFAKGLALARELEPVAEEIKAAADEAAPVVNGVLGLIARFASGHASVTGAVTKVGALVEAAHAAADGAPAALKSLADQLAANAPDRAKGAV